MDRVEKWIPESPETILEDGLLMAALYAVEDEGLIAIAPSDLRSENTAPVELGELDSDQLARLRETCRKCPFGGTGQCKLVISVLTESSLLGQLKSISEYQFDCEVLTCRFSRLSSPWRNQTRIEGSLDWSPEF